MVLRRLVTVVLAAVAALPAAAAAAAPSPLGLTCTPQEGVRFCQGTVPTFDGVPLDVNVTLPATADGGFPLLVLSHGWGGRKAPLVDANRPGNLTGSSLPWAQAGYAVLAISARGFGESCGSVASRLAGGPACAQGWVRLDDTRYEVRDAQHLAGRLVDEGISDGRIGVHGGSYGGGVSNAMTLLRDRVMRPDGTYAPWTTPKGRRLSLAASAPFIPWSDLVSSLVPNGRLLDYVEPWATESRQPKGVMKTSFVTGLYATGNLSGFYAPPGADPQADLTTWFARLNAGEPYDGDPVISGIADEIWAHHSSISIDRSVPPAPTFVASGWTDDLFPADEAIRLRNAVAAAHPDVPFALMFFDTGHQRGTGKRADTVRYEQRLMAWMDRHLKGDAAAEPLRGVETLTQTCPESAPSGGPHVAASWPEMRRGEVRLGDAGAHTLTNAGGDPEVARAVDPIAGGGNACAQVSASDEAGTVNLRFPAATGDGYTLMGAPTIIADIAATGLHPQVVARLWDVAPDGRQTLVARSVYRPEASGRQVFQLHPNGWRFARGHVAKLQLLGRDAPYVRPSNGAFTVRVSGIDARLPVVERPGSEPAVLEPLPYALPAGRRLAPGFGPRSVPVSASPRPGAGAGAGVGGRGEGGRRRARGRAVRARLKLVAGCRAVRLKGADVRRVRRVTVFRAGMRRRTDRRRPYRVSIRGGRGARVRAVATLRGGGRATLRARPPRRCR